MNVPNLKLKIQIVEAENARLRQKIEELLDLLENAVPKNDVVWPEKKVEQWLTVRRYLKEKKENENGTTATQ